METPWVTSLGLLLFLFRDFAADLENHRRREWHHLHHNLDRVRGHLFPMGRHAIAGSPRGQIQPEDRPGLLDRDFFTGHAGSMIVIHYLKTSGILGILVVLTTFVLLIITPFVLQEDGCRRFYRSSDYLHVCK